MAGRWCTVTDYFLRLKHPELAWNQYAVLVRFHEKSWQFAIEYQGRISGYGSPFIGRFPSRQSAGRNGCFALRDILRKADTDIPASWAHEVSEFVNPSQFLLAL